MKILKKIPQGILFLALFFAGGAEVDGGNNPPSPFIHACVVAIKVKDGECLIPMDDFMKGEVFKTLPQDKKNYYIQLFCQTYIGGELKQYLTNEGTFLVCAKNVEEANREYRERTKGLEQSMT